MSARLIGEVIAYLNSGAGAELNPTERLVLVAIAERARDSTRQAWQGGQDDWRLDRIVGTRLKDVLQRLAARGLEVRVPLGTDVRGLPIYAHRGRQLSYRLPFLTEPSPLAGKGDAQAAPLAGKGDAQAAPLTGKGDAVAQKGDAVAQKGDATASPYLSKDLRNPQSSPREPAPTDPLAAIGAEPDEREIILGKIHTTNPNIGNLAAYLAAMYRNGDLAAYLAEIRAATRIETERKARAEAERADRRERIAQQRAEAEARAAQAVPPNPAVAELRTVLPAHHRPSRPATPAPAAESASGSLMPSLAQLAASLPHQALPRADPPRGTPHGIGICVDCAATGEFVLAVNAQAGSHCATHQRQLQEANA